MTRPFSGIDHRRELRSTYDVVVIGAGIGGLICANLLARAGLNVLLIEQHYMVGGYCSTFRRKGFVFDAASHFYPLLGNPASISGKLLADLDVETEWVKMDPVDQFHLPDGTRFSVPADYETYLQTLTQAFPLQRDALHRFFQLVRKLYLLGLLHFFQGSHTRRLAPYLGMTVRDGLNQFFSSDKLKLLLTADCPHWGSPPCRTSLVFDSMLRLSYFEGNYYPVGGSQVFADQLAHQFEVQGGQILTKSLVRRIEVRQGSVHRVQLETGPRRSRRLATVNVGAVVSNADMRQTVFSMVGQEHFPSHYIDQLNRLRPSFPCFLSHIGLRDVSTTLLQRIHGYYWKGWDSDLVGTTAFGFKIFVPTLYEPRMAPAGGHVLIIQKVTNIDYESVTDWQEHKRRIEQSVLQRLNQLIPNLADKMVVCQSASAQTSHRFTMNYQGAMLGWEMAPDQLGVHRPDTQSPIRGLHFAGQWTRPGGGITPVIISAMRVAQHMLGTGPYASSILKDTAGIEAAGIQTEQGDDGSISCGSPS